MNTKATFRIGLIFYIGVLAFMGSTDLMWPELLHPDLREFLESDAYLSEVGDPFVIVGFSLALTPLFIVSMVGMFVFWSPARHLFLAGAVLGLPFLALLGPQVLSGLSAALSGAFYTVTGALLVLLYVPPVSQLFKRET